MRRSPQCAFVLIICERTGRIINSRENCKMHSARPSREPASSNRYGLVLSSEMICAFYYSKQLRCSVCTHIFAAYLLARIAMLKNYCALHSCLVFGVRKNQAFARWLNIRRICFYLRQFSEPPERVRGRNRIISRRRSLCFLNSNQEGKQRAKNKRIRPYAQLSLRA